ncbi:AzlC family ABC transporter permease [Herbaspirillum sp. RTI4]|uniref:AzlC family ABC transporter permease n=1 Tax=Herbaspirillum sp. RTI4 TaxID=3048640 RepID=UPI002AB52FDA|nr:AzlC family ABC transporter permease [Herbaspirillum sp. RTI4]MDY7576800.1 AzlC family ABC transporter permease [Herbaspirillum sp. RTI4]MEA9981396.1 AzlC family ABC transporter permease [Herbaspirillum sp. RTI4]
METRAAQPVAASQVRVRERSQQIERAAFWAGFKASAGTMPAMFAWGIVSGMAMLKSGMSVWQAMGMTLFVYAGSAQFAALPLLVDHAPALMIFFTAVIVNLRFMIFAAIMAPHFRHLPWYQRLWYSYFSGDIAIIYFPQRFSAETAARPAGKIGYYSGISYPSWYSWQCGSVLGILLASQIPASWNIGFAGTLALLAILIPMIVNAATLVGALVGGAVAVAGIGLPFRMGLLLAVVLGMGAAMLTDVWIEKRKA